MTTVINTPEDIQWLKETALKGVPLPQTFQDFKFAYVVGNQDAPQYVDLFQKHDPMLTDDYYRIRFDCDAPVYCEAVMMAGLIDQPYTGTHTKFAREGANNG